MPPSRPAQPAKGESAAPASASSSTRASSPDAASSPDSASSSDDASSPRRSSSRTREVLDQTPQEAKDLKDTALGHGSEKHLDEVQGRWEDRLAWPVLVAALLSVPAVFLTLLDEPWATVGHVGLWLVTAVLVVETVVFFLVSPRKIGWILRNWWLIGLTAAGVLAVIFSIGPLQLFRILRSVGALRVLRAKQMARAGESLGKKGSSRWSQVLGKVLATLVVASFVVIAMVDPDSEARTSIESLVGEEGAIAAAVAAGMITLVGMYFLVRSPRDEDGEDGEHDEDEDDQDDGSEKQRPG